MGADLVLRMTLALMAGAAVGAERELRGHVAGVRTHALVSVGAALFTLAGIEGAGGITVDPMRVAAQVVSGIGFIGAGAILRDSGGVRGLTTASTVWVSGALGVVCALGDVLLATTGIGLVVLILSSRRPLRWLMRRVARTVEVAIGLEYELGHGTIGPLIKAATETESTILSMTMDDRSDDAASRGHRLASVVLRTPAGEYQELVDTVSRLEQRREVRFVQIDVRGPTPKPGRSRGERSFQ